MNYELDAGSVQSVEVVGFIKESITIFNSEVLESYNDRSSKRISFS